MKYELIRNDNSSLYQIKALKDFGEITAGTMGGWVSSHENLSHEGDCWIHPNAFALGNSRIRDNAQLYDRTIASNNAIVGGNARLHGYSEVKQDASVIGQAQLYNTASVQGSALLCGTAEMHGNSVAEGEALLLSGAVLTDNQHVGGSNIVDHRLKHMKERTA